jgi:thiamine-phosphate pyrophosphorylase
MQLYAITDRRRLLSSIQGEGALCQRLLSLADGWAAAGVHFIQLREKDLDEAQLESLARALMARIDGKRTRLLINVSAPQSAALALAAGAAGVHLAGKPAPGSARSVRQIFRAGGRDAIVSVPCHSLEEVHMARKEEVDLMLFSPVFEKLSVGPEGPAPQGREGLRRACVAAQGTPVFALGGVTGANTPDCLAQGAAGVAGIRLFATDDWRQLAEG